MSHLNFKCKSFIPFAAVVRVVAASTPVSTSVGNYIIARLFFYFAFLIYSFATRKLVVFVIALPSSPGQGVRYDSTFLNGETVLEHEKIMSQWVRVCGLMRFSMNNDAIMCLDTADWIRARALTSFQMQRRNINVTRARLHVKFVRGNASVGTCFVYVH